MANSFLPIAHPVAIHGQHHQGGAYVLGMTLSQAVSLSFGRFQNGRPVALAAGSYLYVGSAMGQRGSSSLARRLLRHATRSDGRPPHTMRPALLTALRDAGLGPIPLHPPASKTPHWHIDYLLDHPAATLDVVLAVRSTQALERPIATWVAAQPDALPVAAGLGASDHPGHTHLFRVAEPAAIWTALTMYVTSL